MLSAELRILWAMRSFSLLIGTSLSLSAASHSEYEMYLARGTKRGLGEKKVRPIKVLSLLLY
jgi:hypothetical protein